MCIQLHAFRTNGVPGFRCSLSECSFFIVYVGDSSCSSRQLQRRPRESPQAAESCNRIPARIRGSVRMATHMHPDGHRGGCLNVRLESLHVLALSYFLESLKTELRSAERCDRKVRERSKINRGGLFVSRIRKGSFQQVSGSPFSSHGHPLLDFILQHIK